MLLILVVITPDINISSGPLLVTELLTVDAFDGILLDNFMGIIPYTSYLLVIPRVTKYLLAYRDVKYERLNKIQGKKFDVSLYIISQGTSISNDLTFSLSIPDVRVLSDSTSHPYRHPHVYDVSKPVSPCRPQKSSVLLQFTAPHADHSHTCPAITVSICKQMQ